MAGGVAGGRSANGAIDRVIGQLRLRFPLAADLRGRRGVAQHQPLADHDVQ